MSNKRKAILLVGKAQVGKDTFFDNASMVYHRYAYADNLKQVAATIMNVPVSKFYDCKTELNESWGMTHREALQVIGTDVLRSHFRDDVWVKSMIESIEIDTGYKEHIIVTDCRFPNEVDAISEYFDTVVVHILRPDVNEPKGGISGHASEADFDFTADYTIVNDGTVEEYIEKISNVLTEVFG